MSKMIALAAGLVVVSGAAMARPSSDYSSFEAVIPAGSVRGTTFVENFEAFNLGAAVPQFGWGSQFADNFSIVNSGVAGFGSRTAEHFSDASGFAGFEIISPTFASTDNIAADIRINNVGATGTGTLYQFVSQNTGAALVNTRINFNANGTIEALQAVGGVGVFSATSGSWSFGETFRIGVEVLNDGTLNIYQNNSLIFTGTDIVHAIQGASSGLDSMAIWAANTVAQGNDTLWLDNIGAIPAPGAAALMGLAGLAGLRRRR
jgi:hypothetical protein